MIGMSLALSFWFGSMTGVQDDPAPRKPQALPDDSAGDAGPIHRIFGGYTLAEASVSDLKIRHSSNNLGLSPSSVEADLDPHLIQFNSIVLPLFATAGYFELGYRYCGVSPVEFSVKGGVGQENLWLSLHIRDSGAYGSHLADSDTTDFNASLTYGFGAEAAYRHEHFRLALSVSERFGESHSLDNHNSAGREDFSYRTLRVGLGITSEVGESVRPFGGVTYTRTDAHYTDRNGATGDRFVFDFVSAHPWGLNFGLNFMSNPHLWWTLGGDYGGSIGGYASMSFIF